MQLTAARVLVVGATGVLGSALAEALAGAGTRLAVTGRDPGRLAEVAAAVGAAAYELDLLDVEACAHVVSRAAEALGGLDLLVVASGVAAFGAAADTEDAVAEELFAVNTLGPMAVCRAALPLLTDGGGIAVISAILADTPMAGMAAYSASKAALSGYLRGLRREVRRQRLTVLDVRPPHLDTGQVDRAIAGRAPKPPLGHDLGEVVALTLKGITDGRRNSPLILQPAASPCADRTSPCSRVTDGAGRAAPRHTSQALPIRSGQGGGPPEDRTPNPRIIFGQHLVMAGTITSGKISDGSTHYRDAGNRQTREALRPQGRCPSVAGRGDLRPGHADVDRAGARSVYCRQLGRAVARGPDRHQAEHPLPLPLDPPDAHSAGRGSPPAGRRLTRRGRGLGGPTPGARVGASDRPPDAPRLSLLLSLAVRDGRIPRNPADRVPLPRVTRGEPRFLTRDEVERLADAAGADGDGVRLLAYTGLRFGEMAGIRVRRVDFLRRRVTIAEALTEPAESSTARPRPTSNAPCRCRPTSSSH